MSDERPHAASIEFLPEIHQVLPQVLEYRAGVRLMLKGRNLDVATAVLISAREAPIRSASGGSLLVDLPSGLVAGVQVVLAVRDVELGSPPTPHRIHESNPASFVLRPRLVEPPVYESAVGDPAAPRVIVEVAPKVASEQRVALLLNQIDGHPGRPPASYTVSAGVGVSGSSLRFPVAAVESGTYLARVSVSGVASALEVDQDPESPTFEQYVGPRVVVP